MQETGVWSLGQEDPLGKEMATHSNILAWRIPWTDEPNRLQSMGFQRVGHDWATNTHTYETRGTVRSTLCATSHLISRKNYKVRSLSPFLQIRKSNIRHIKCFAPRHTSNSDLLTNSSHIQIASVILLTLLNCFIQISFFFPNYCSLSNVLMLLTFSSIPQYSMVYRVPMVPSFIFFAQVQNPRKGLFSGLPFLPLRVIAKVQ